MIINQSLYSLVSLPPDSQIPLAPVLSRSLHLDNEVRPCPRRLSVTSLSFSACFKPSDAWWVTDTVLFVFLIRIGHINMPCSFRWHDRMNECDGGYTSSSRQGHSGRRTDVEFNLRWITCSNTNQTLFPCLVLAPHRHQRARVGTRWMWTTTTTWMWMERRWEMEISRPRYVARVLELLRLILFRLFVIIITLWQSLITHRSLFIGGHSIKCSTCNKRFRNTALANFHAEKSGHDQFEEGTEESYEYHAGLQDAAFWANVV